MSNKEKKVIYDPLTELMEYYSSYKSVEDKEKEDEKGDKPIEEKLRLRIIEGNKIHYTLSKNKLQQNITQ